MITAEGLHAAADKVGMHTSYEENNLEEGALIEFTDNAVFHPPQEPLAVAYGIMIGIRAALDTKLDADTEEIVDELIRRIEGVNRSMVGITDFRLRMIEWLKRLKDVAKQEGW